jgi:hypothetical protein
VRAKDAIDGGGGFFEDDPPHPATTPPPITNTQAQTMSEASAPYTLAGHRRHPTLARANVLTPERSGTE